MEGQGTSRRRFLGTAAGATGVALGAAVWGAGTAAAAVAGTDGAKPLMADTRSYVSGRFALDLGGTKAGWLQDVEGGHATADVVNEKQGTDGIVHKHIAGVKYEDISLRIGFSMSKAIYDWISASWSMNYQRKNGSIVAADFDLDAKAEREFFNALISETGIPACDGASKEPAYLTLKFAPEFTRVKPASGKVSVPSAKGDQQKTWLPSNFRLQIDGLDCSKVSKVDAFTIKQSIVENAIGETRDYQKEPATLEFPNLKVSVAQVGAGTWYDWHEDFVINGNAGQDKEKSGSLTFLTADRKGELARVNFIGLGIFKVSDDALDTDDSPGRVTFEMYCEQMTFTYLGGTPVGEPAPMPTNSP